MIHEIMKSLGIEGYKILINHTKVLDYLVQKCGVEARREEFLTILDKYDTHGKEGELDKLGVLAELEEKGFEGIVGEQAKDISNGTELKILFNRMFYRIFNMQVGGNRLLNSCRVSPFLSRGLSYYTGFLFEVKMVEDGLSVLGGGGYDVGDDGKIKGLGFSFGLERLHAIWKEKEKEAYSNKQHTRSGILLCVFTHLIDDSLPEHFRNRVREEREQWTIVSNKPLPSQYNPNHSSDYPYNHMEQYLFLDRFGTLVSKYMITVTPATGDTDAELTYTLFLYEPSSMEDGDTKVLSLSPIKTMEGMADEKDRLEKVEAVIKLIKDKEEEKKSKVEV